jgi:hypothetical protein
VFDLKIAGGTVAQSRPWFWPRLGVPAVAVDGTGLVEAWKSLPTAGGTFGRCSCLCRLDSSHRVVARNSATESENRIHADGVARKYGFKGSLVPGVTT